MLNLFQLAKQNFSTSASMQLLNCYFSGEQQQCILYWWTEEQCVSNVNSNFGWLGTPSWIILHQAFCGWPFPSSACAALMWNSDGKESDEGSAGSEQCPVALVPARVLWISNEFLIYHKRCSWFDNSCINEWHQIIAAEICMLPNSSVTL